VPLLVFAFLFGLSMDYEVFILSRIKEAHDAGLPTDDAVVDGLGHTGRLVTCAALILFLAFAALAAGPVVQLKVFATAMGVGILLDATVVRALLVPASCHCSAGGSSRGMRNGPPPWPRWRAVLGSCMARSATIRSGHCDRSHRTRPAATVNRSAGD
jgi:predicted RND superfamily exporter protein